MPQKSDLTKELSDFGLNEIETKIYIHLLNNPPQTMLDLSRQLAIPRTSIYDNSQRLIEKGLAEKIVKYKSQKLKAYPIEMLKLIIDRKKAELDQLEDSFGTIEKNLAQTTSMVGSTEVRHYQGREGLQQMMWNSLKADKNIVGYSTFGRVDIVGRTFQKRFVHEFQARRLDDAVIINPNQTTIDCIKRHVKPNIHHLTYSNIRTIPGNKMYISGDTMIYNDTIAISHWNDKDIVGVEIDNTEFVKTQKSIFAQLWETAKPLEL